MTSTLALRLLPFVALAAGLVAFAAWLRWALRARALAKRPVLLVAAVAGVLPAAYVALVWVGAFSDHYLRFERPLGVLAGALALPWIAARLTRLSPRQSRSRRLATELLIGLSALAAAFVVPGPELGKPIDRLTVLLAVDRSRSIDMVPSAPERIKNELLVAERSMKERDLVGTIVFAADAATEDPPRPRSELPAPQKIELGRDATDIASGIRRALAEVPAGSSARIALLSDGVVTRGDAMQAAAAAVAAEVPIDVLPLDQRVVPDVRVVAVRMPTRADEDEPMDLRIVTSSPAPTEVEIRVERDGELIRKGTAKIEAGEDVLRLRESARGAGLHRYDVEVTALDPSVDQAAEDNAGSAFVRVRGPATALVLDGDDETQFVARGLSEAAFHVTTGGKSAVPADLGELARYDLVVLSDVRASDLAPSQIDALATYARDFGGGLLLLGGDRSMGPGGYARTPIEEVSPVSFDLKQERRRASLAEVIAIDYSGSMGMTVASGETKLALANEAAARSASLLGPGDRLGVEHVDTIATWTVPLAPVVDTVGIANKIRATTLGGGGIYTDLALREGYAALEREKVNLRHMLLFADGDDAERLNGCRAQVSAALAKGITTSVVALGRGSDVAELEVLSKIGTGRFYLVEDATRLPSVFAEETVLAARSAINETDFRPSLVAPGAPTRGIDFGAAPNLKGYVVTIPKPRATVLLAGPEGDPLLATWSVGVGRAAAFTSDLKDRWGVAWTAWPGAARLVGQLGRDVARKADDPHVRLEADASGGELHVRADVVGDDGRAQTFRRLTARIGGPSGFARDVPLEPVGAGAYVATVPLSRPGTYLVSARDDKSGDVVGTTGAALGAGEELRPTGTDRALLARIANMTGGKVRDNLAGIFDDRPPPRFAYTPIAPPFVILAAIAMLLGVAARRLAMPEAVVAWWQARAEARAARSAAIASRRMAQPPGAASQHTLGTLLDAKARVQPTHASPPPPLAPPPIPRPPPVAARAPLAHAAGDAPPPSARFARPSAPPPAAPEASAPTSSSGRPLTAAEILLARRRGRRP